MKKRKLEDTLRAVFICLDNINYLISKQKSGTYARHVLLDAIEGELKTGAYEDAEKLLIKLGEDLCDTMD